MLVQSASAPGTVSCKDLPGLSVDVEWLHVPLADILIKQLEVAISLPASWQLTWEDVFRDTAIFYAKNMAQSALSEQGKHAGETVQDIPRIWLMFCIWQDMSLYLLSGICDLGLTAMQ